MSRIIVYGASGHARYTIDALERAGDHEIVGLIDDGVPSGTSVYGYPVLGVGADLRRLRDEVGFDGGVVAIGDNFVRSKVAERIERVVPDFEFVSAIHPFGVVGRDCVVGAGTVLLAGAVIGSSSSVGEHSFLATNSSIDHNSALGRFGSLAPGAATGGGVRIGDFSTISVGAAVIHGITIGEHTVVGAGAAVVRALPGYVVAVGVPCRVVRRREPGERYL